MFADLHALAQSATLLIAVSAEGDDLRVSVTPILAGDKAKAHALRPLSLLGTPAELDADFGAALIAWQAPRKSLVEQAEAVAGATDDEKTPAASKPKATPAKAEKAKPGPKPKAAATAAGPAAAPAGGTTGAETASGEAAPEFVLAPPPVEMPTANEDDDLPPAPPPAPVVVDTKTLDLF